MIFLSKYKNILLIVISIVFVSILLIYILKRYLFQYYKNKNQEIVISRYNEKLQWINQKPFNKHPIVIYNKGINEYYEINQNVVKRVNIPNVGRESHTYLYHIINNYDNLADVTIFLPGSIDLHHKYNRAKQMIEKVEETNCTVFSAVYEANIVKTQFNFTLDNYLSSHINNKEINQNATIQKSNIRPYGKWFEQTFIDGEKNEYVSYCGIFSISKNNILQKPKSYYEKLLNELNTHHNPEVGHYIERSWYAIFYPYNNNIHFLPY